ARDGSNGRVRQGAERLHRPVEGPLAVAEVRAEADVCPCHRASVVRVQFTLLHRIALLSCLALVLVGTAHAQPEGTALVEVRPGAAPLGRGAGGVSVAPELRLGRIPASSLPTLRDAGVVVRSERDRLFLRTSSALDQPAAGANDWWRTAIGADAATAPGPGKPVTIVDSGLVITHREFASRPNTMLLNDQTTSFGDDDDGTEVASVIAADVRMTGVYPQAILRSYDASPFGFITAGDAVRGIIAGTRGGPGVINLSFGGEEDDPLVHQAVLYAFRRGSLVVASAGNDGLAGNPLSYPASYPHLLTAAA